LFVIRAFVRLFLVRSLFVHRLFVIISLFVCCLFIYRLFIYPLFIYRRSFIVCSTFVFHRLFIVRSSFVHCLFIVCLPLIHRSSIVRSSSVHSSFVHFLQGPQEGHDNEQIKAHNLLLGLILCLAVWIKSLKPLAKGPLGDINIIASLCLCKLLLLEPDIVAPATTTRRLRRHKACLLDLLG
jgi:hypothetical protein